MSDSITLYNYLIKLKNVPELTEVNNVAFITFDEVGNVIFSGEDDSVILAISNGQWDWVMRAD